ncbi:MAG: helix-turn-helix transcriptional regulator [Bosea sp.]|uniref:helix-turn-helix domain-containing protein n=1 Tax=Bosea sp. (in: a-proteobacteria) TaxID=1871050 RepID=UPI0023A50B5A|nr:helix-turn-helix transcriptional regulator [Bosea sp. (in: a-proteobacteria)]MCP4738292.1 helix-turn-helix transcriptional regulator [Bosea sp. (in: a-proteobacteria)]
MRPGLHARVIALLVAARRDHGLTQADLARRLGRSTNFVFRVEAGARHLDVAEFIAIARALEVDPYELLRQAEAQG